jgi:Protein of unknown function (DUF4229)
MAFLQYTLLRVLLFLAVAALLWIVGIRDVWLVMFAILCSGIISVFALSRSRDAASVALVNRMSTVKGRMAARTAAEDAWNDQQRATSGDGESAGMAAATAGIGSGMTDDRRTWQGATPGEDPRERDEELTSPAALDKLAAQQGAARESQEKPQEPVDRIGTSSSNAPGRDLPDLDDAADVTHLRDEA